MRLLQEWEVVRMKKNVRVDRDKSATSVSNHLLFRIAECECECECFTIFVIVLTLKFALQGLIYSYLTLIGASES